MLLQVFQPKDTESASTELGADETAVYTLVDDSGAILATTLHEADPDVVQKLNKILENQNQIIGQNKKIAQQFMRPSDPNVEQKLDGLVERQNDTMEKLEKFSQCLASLSVQMQDAVSQITSYREDHVVSLAEASTFERTRFVIKPIDNLQGLEEFECILSDPDERHKLIKQYSILCSRSEGKGVNCAYKLLTRIVMQMLVVRWQSGGYHQNSNKRVQKCTQFLFSNGIFMG